MVLDVYIGGEPINALKCPKILLKVYQHVIAICTTVNKHYTVMCALAGTTWGKDMKEDHLHAETYMIYVIQHIELFTQ